MRPWCKAWRGARLGGLFEHSVGNRAFAEGIVALDEQNFPVKRSWYKVEPERKKLSVVAQAFRGNLLAGRTSKNGEK